MVNENEVLDLYKIAKQNIENAIKDANRNIEDVLVIGASKTMPLERIRFVHDNTDIKVFGENRVQELMDKYTDDFTWHFIGQLQSNKVKYIIDKVALIHSVDRLSLAEEIDRQAKKHNKVQDFLIEVNMGSEITKGGVAPNDVLDFAKEVTKFPNMRLSGLMSVLPKAEDKELEKYYSELSSIFNILKSTKLENADVRYLSAGMSNDYAMAIKYGANIIRLGRAVFGER